MNPTHPQTAAPASGGSAPGGYWRRGRASNRYSRKRTVVRGSCSRSKARPPSGTGGEGNSRRPGFLRDIQRLLREPQARAPPEGDRAKFGHWGEAPPWRLMMESFHLPLVAEREALANP